VEGGVGIRDGGIRSKERSFRFESRFSAGKGGMVGLDLKFGSYSRKVAWEAEIFATVRNF
jgi:hypothetical protein